MTKEQTLKSCISKYQAKRKKIQTLMEENRWNNNESRFMDYIELKGKRKSAHKRYVEQLIKIEEHIKNLQDMLKQFEPTNGLKDIK